MIVGLCWIVGSYALCIGMVHLIRRLNQARRKNQVPIHYLLLTRNNQTQIEWYLRYLAFIAWWQGRSFKVTLLDDGSTDDTLAIAGCMYDALTITVQNEADNREQFTIPNMDECTVVMNLRDRSDLVHVPVF
jgi:hypothetical protein